MNTTKCSLNLLALMFSCLLLGCAESSSPSDPTATATAPDSHNSFHNASIPHTIVAGQGITDCQIGDDKRSSTTLFGDIMPDATGYLVFPKAGLDVYSNRDGVIGAIHFYYRLPGYSAFDGKTDKGIGISSSISEVIDQYGEPDRIGESTVSEFGAVPGAKEKSLQYWEQGIIFTFWDEKLADIRVLGKTK